jgi:hypothetical protein
LTFILVLSVPYAHDDIAGFDPGQGPLV